MLKGSWMLIQSAFISSYILCVYTIPQFQPKSIKRSQTKTLVFFATAGIRNTTFQVSQKVHSKELRNTRYSRNAILFSFSGLEQKLYLNKMEFFFLNKVNTLGKRGKNSVKRKKISFLKDFLRNVVIAWKKLRLNMKISNLFCSPRPAESTWFFNEFKTLILTQNGNMTA